MIYLDYNATAPMKPAVRAAMLEAMERYGNPSSVHRYGRIARRYIEEARANVAALAGGEPAQVIFTSGGTEANNLVLNGFAPDAIIASSIEHDSVLFGAAQKLPVNASGVVDLGAAENILRAAKPGSLVSVMMVNNETGVIQPVEEIVRLAKSFGHLVHTDAIQAAGRLPIDFKSLGVDFLTLSAHKIGGPQGIGALVVGPKVVLSPLVRGGGQEMNRRAGTENVPGIIGFGTAARLAADDLRDMPRLTLLRDLLEQKLQGAGGEDTVVPGASAPRVGNTLCISMRGMSGETQVAAMDLAGVAVSAGSACSSGKVKASHVLKAMGYGEEVTGSAIRISLGWNTEEREIEACVEAWKNLYRRAQSGRKKAA